MADVASVAQGAQIGVESTAGTLVAADKRLDSISLVDGPEGQSDTFRPDGHKYAALTIPGKEWTGIDFTGKLDYAQTAYLVQSLVRKVTPVQIGATTGYTHTIAPQNAAEDTHQTYSIEKGGSVRAHTIAYGIVDSLVIDISRDSCDVSGTMFGRRMTDGATMTASPTAVELVPVLPRLFDVYLDTTSGGLGGTKLLRAFTGRITLNNLVGTIWPINSAFNSFTAHVETPPVATITTFVEHDAAGAAFLDYLRSGATNFLRLKAVGDNIGTSADYTFQLDAAVKAKSIGKHQDREGIYGWEVTLDIVNNAAWGKPYEFKFVNQVSAL